MQVKKMVNRHDHDEQEKSKHFPLFRRRKGRAQTGRLPLSGLTFLRELSRPESAPFHKTREASLRRVSSFYQANGKNTGHRLRMPLLLILLHRGGRKGLLPPLSRRQAEAFRTVQALDPQGGLRQRETQGIAQCLHAFERILPFIRIKFVQARSQGFQPRKRIMADQGQVAAGLQG